MAPHEVMHTEQDFVAAALQSPYRGIERCRTSDRLVTSHLSTLVCLFWIATILIKWDGASSKILSQFREVAVATRVSGAENNCTVDSWRQPYPQHRILLLLPSTKPLSPISSCTTSTFNRQSSQYGFLSAHTHPHPSHPKSGPFDSHAIFRHGVLSLRF